MAMRLKCLSSRVQGPPGTHRKNICVTVIYSLSVPTGRGRLVKTRLDYIPPQGVRIGVKKSLLHTFFQFLKKFQPISAQNHDIAQSTQRDLWPVQYVSNLVNHVMCIWLLFRNCFRYFELCVSEKGRGKRRCKDAVSSGRSRKRWFGRKSITTLLYSSPSTCNW